MTREEIFEAWAPASDRFSPWAKPVLFAHLDEAALDPAQLEPDPTWLRRDLVDALAPTPGQGPHPYREDSRVRDAAMVVDLPGAESVRVGLALAAMGFRPVPLYNAVPSPQGVVALRPIQAALVVGAPRLATLMPAAPPAFLVDADRLGGDREIVPGLFDNRSVCRASDFPSPDFLWEAGIRRAVLIQRGAHAADDLAPILFDWQRRGIDLWLERTDEEGAAGRYQMPRPSWLRQLAHRVRRWAMPLRPDGAYGHLVKHSSGG